MQKIINVIALLSGLVSLSLGLKVGYLYFNKDAIIEDIRSRTTEEITKAITESLPGMIESAMPELPNTTGGVSEYKNMIPESTGLPF